MKKLILSLLGLGTAAVLVGCHGGAYPPQNTMKFDLENQAPFVELDSHMARTVTCSGLQQSTLPDGRMEVKANVRNRETRRIHVQVNCVFKDEQGFSTGDETPFQTLILTENSQETVSFTSMNPKAKKYTIRVREAR